jgi:DNA-binding response OmpR family regulator
MDRWRGAGERVLVVEDDADTRNALRRSLETLGYTATAAASAEEAGLLPEVPPVLLLLADLVLPDARGTDLAAGLRAR